MVEGKGRREVVPGQRIYLGVLCPEDVDFFADWFSDLEVTAYVGSIGRSFMREHQEEWYRRVVSEKDNPTFAIVSREDHRLVGGCGLTILDRRADTAELSIVIGDKAVWGQGLGTEAVRLLCDYGFTYLDLHNIRLHHASFNERAHCAYLAAGFAEVGRVRGAVLFKGRRYDDVVMDLVRDDLSPGTCH